MSSASDRFDGIDACGADAASRPGVPIERPSTVGEFIDELRARLRGDPSTQPRRTPPQYSRWHIGPTAAAIDEWQRRSRSQDGVSARARFSRIAITRSVDVELAPAEQERVGALVDLGGERRGLIVEERPGRALPSAALESARGPHPARRVPASRRRQRRSWFVSFMVAGPFSLVWSSFGTTAPPRRTHRSWHDRPPACFAGVDGQGKGKLIGWASEPAGEDRRIAQSWPVPSPSDVIERCSSCQRPRLQQSAV
jgi:hypothetical protein